MILTTHHNLYNPTILYILDRGPSHPNIFIYKRSRHMVIKSCFANMLSIIYHSRIIVVDLNMEIVRIGVYAKYASVYIIIDEPRIHFTLIDSIVILRKLVARYYAIGANGQLYVIPKNE